MKYTPAYTMEYEEISKAVADAVQEAIEGVAEDRVIIISNLEVNINLAWGGGAHVGDNNLVCEKSDLKNHPWNGLIGRLKRR